ncbi:MAG TPA: hypothetical protein ENK23_05405 [Sorangium sp.]|nr:hypothetical protein [Sorangium sp.]
MVTTITPLARCCACEDWSEAEVLARHDLEAFQQRDAQPLAHARAVLTLANVLIDAQRPEEATALLFEARRRYRPFFDDDGCVAEYQLAVAKHAAASERSSEAEAALDLALEKAAGDPRNRLVYARALRFRAHLSILRWEPDDAVPLLLRALQQVEGNDGPGVLLRLQFLFSLAEVYVGIDDPKRARAAVAEAVALLNGPLATEKAIVAQGRSRAAYTEAIIDSLEANHG